jgi:acetyl esterase/lipase
LLYLHGGGYIACSPRSHRPITSAFARAGLRTFAPDYRLAPEHPFPAAVEDALAVYCALSAETEPRRIVLAGDSAGGGLSLALLLSLQQQGIALPAAVVLFSPLTDLTVSGGSVHSNRHRCAMFNQAILARVTAYYMGNRDPRSPLASPLYAQLRALPPLLIQVGEDETLRDDSVRLSERLRSTGNAAQLQVWPAVPHVWQLFHRFVPEGRHSLAAATGFMRAHLPSPVAASAAPVSDNPRTAESAAASY